MITLLVTKSFFAHTNRETMVITKRSVCFGPYNNINSFDAFAEREQILQWKIKQLKKDLKDSSITGYDLHIVAKSIGNDLVFE